MAISGAELLDMSQVDWKDINIYSKLLCFQFGG